MNTSILDSLLLAPATERDRLGYTNTLPEIVQQPKLWPLAAEVAVRDLLPLCQKEAGCPLLLAGAGSSHFAGLSVQPALKRAGVAAEAVPSTEILLDPESVFPRRSFVLVSIARSGNSPEGNAVVRLAEALRPGLVRQVAVTCNPEGELAALVGGLPGGVVSLMPEGSDDRSLAMTSSFTCLAVAILSMAYAGRPQVYRSAVLELSAAAAAQLPVAAQLADDLARDRYGRVIFLASRPFLGGAHEAHLKVQELSGGTVIAKAEDTLGFRHGFMAAVDDSTLLVAFLSSDPYRRQYEKELLAEIRAKKLGKTVVAVSDPDPDLAELCDHALPWGGPVSDDARAILSVLFGQLLGTCFSLSLGLRPDNPSPEGVINRVVQGVRVHRYPEVPA